MKLTVLVVIFAKEILGIFAIIVHDGTKQDQGSRRFGIQHAEPSQVSQQILSSEGTSFSSVVVHRPPNSKQSEDHSGGGLTVQDPPKGWPLSEMHISFDSHGHGEDWKKSKEVKAPVTHKGHAQHPNQLEQSFNKPLQEPQLHKQQQLQPIKRQPDQPKVHHQRHPLEYHQRHQETQQLNVYQQQPRLQENVHQTHEKTEVEIHPQVIIKLPEQQSARLLRPLYVQDPSFSQQIPPSLNAQEKPFHPSVQISDSVNNEAMLTPVQYHNGHTELFSAVHKKPVSPKLSEPITQVSNNNAKKTQLAPGASEEKHLREGIKVVRMRHPHTTLGASYSVGFTAPHDAFKNSNQLQNLIIKEHVENKVPVRHGKTLHKQKTPNSAEINNESTVYSKNVPPFLTPTHISPDVVKNENYAFLDGGRQQVGFSSDTFPSSIHYQPQLINLGSSGTHSSPHRFHQTPTTHHHSSQLTFEEARQVPVGAAHYQKLLTRDLIPPPVRTHANPEGKPGGPLSLGFAPPRAGHSNTPALTSNKVINFVPSGGINNAFSEANSPHYISDTPNAVHQHFPSFFQSHYNAGGVHDTVNDKGNQGSATTGNAVSSAAPVSQNYGHRHPVNSGGSSEFHGFSKGAPLYSSTHGHAQLKPPNFHVEPHAQQLIDATKHHTKVTANTQGNKNLALPEFPPQSNGQGSHVDQHGSQKNAENVFAGFKNGQFQGGFLGNIGYSLAGQDIRPTFTHAPHVHLGSNSGNVGQNVVHFNKDAPQNIPGYLNVNSGAIHLGHPTTPLLYSQQPFVQSPGGHVQTLYVPQNTVYTNSLLGVPGNPNLVANIQPSASVPINQGHANGAAAPAAPGVYSVPQLTYLGAQLLNAAPQGNVDVNAPGFHHAQAAAFPGIGAAYPQNVQLPYSGAGGTTFVLSQMPLQDYRQQSHLQQLLPLEIPQQSTTSHAQVNSIQTQNVRIPSGSVQANPFGSKLTQQQHQNSQHATKSSSSQQHQASRV